MDKRAQNRSLRSRIWETINPLGKGWEALDSEGAEVMNKMRLIDETIRDVAADVKPIIREARSALRQRNYLAASHSIVGFHARCRLVGHLLSAFEKGIEINHSSYLLSNFDEPYQNELLDSDPDFKIEDNLDLARASAEFDFLVKEAGPLTWMKDQFLDKKDRVTDTATNLLTGPGLGKLLRDKRFNVGFMKKTKTMTTDLVSKSDKMLRDLLSIFNELEKGVSRRNPRYYSIQAKKYISKFAAYHELYKNYHKEIIAPLKAQRDASKAQSMKAKEQEATTKQEAYKQYQAQQQAAQEAAHQKEYDDYNTRTEHEGKQIENLVQEQNKNNYKQTTKYTEPDFNEWKKRNTPEPALTQEEKLKQLDKFKEKDNGIEDVPFRSEFNDMLPEDEEFKQLTNRVKPEVKKDIPKPLHPNIGVAASHKDFIGQITSFANNEEVSEFVNELINYSEQLEDTDPVASGELLAVATNIINDYKIAGIFDFLKGKPADSSPAESAEEKENLPLGLRQLQPKPQELVEERNNLLRQKKVELPNGRVDRAYAELGFLRRITPDKMRVTGDAARFIINTFAKRLAKVKDIDDLEPYMDSIESNLIPVLKQAIYNGWVIQSDPVVDTFNPRDKYLEIYTRLNLANIDPSLTGLAKLHIGCRASADHGTLTVRGIKKHFEIDAPKSSPVAPPTATPKRAPSPEQEEEAPVTPRSPNTQEFDDEGEEIDHGYEDPNDYDTE